MLSSVKRILKAGTVALLLATSVGVAVAAETTNAPASTCVATGSGAVRTRTDGQVENASSSSVTVVCPADRKQINGGFATVLSGRVWVVDQHSTQNVCCQVVSKNPGSGTVTAGTSVCSSGESSSDQSLTLPSITDPYTFSHFYVQCTLPALEGSASRLLTVRTTQE